MSKNDGSEIEGFVRDVITANNWSLHRLYDTKSAGKFLPSQPADFIGVLNGVPLLLECKSSDRFDTFKDCKLKDFIKPTQYASFTMWEKNGGCGLFVFYSLFGKKIEIWEGGTVRDAYREGWDETHEPSCTFKKKDLADKLVAEVEKWRW